MPATAWRTRRSPRPRHDDDAVPRASARRYPPPDQADRRAGTSRLAGGPGQRRRSPPADHANLRLDPRQLPPGGAVSDDLDYRERGSGPRLAGRSQNLVDQPVAAMHVTAGRCGFRVALLTVTTRA